MNHLKLIIQREYLTKVKNKSFIIMTFLSPIIMVVLISVVVYLSQMNNDTIKNISILDLPAFGFMSDDFQANCFEMPWPIQINMATYHQFLSANWSTNWNRKIITECKGLSMNWRDYVRENNPESGKYPPILRKNTFFNFTEHIKKDMPTYLASYAASFQTISNLNINATMWNEVARRVFSKTNPDDFIKTNGYYDKLIIDCAFKEPLMRHKPDMAEGCLDFYHSLTSNGLCYTFNGIDSFQRRTKIGRRPIFVQVGL